MSRSVLEFEAKPTSQLLGSGAVSVVVHAVIVAAAVVATSGSDIDERPLPANSIARFLAPPNRTAAQRAQAEQIRWVNVTLPRGFGIGVPDVQVAAAEPPRMVSGLDLRDAAPMPELVGRDSVYSVLQVDSAAYRYEWSAAPAYPARMMELQQGGFVRARWVVDERGYADTMTFVILQTSHEEFSKAVRDALPFMRFRPGTISGVPVRQLVQQDFTFRITTTADTSRARPPSS